MFICKALFQIWLFCKVSNLKKYLKIEIKIVNGFLPTKHIGVHMNSFKRVRAFQIELEFGSVVGF